MVQPSTEEVKNKSGEDLRIIEDIGNEKLQFVEKINRSDKIEEEEKCVRGSTTQQH